MSALHFVRVRRTRRLPMPLPPKPKRPLGPPILFVWKGVDIRVRADVGRAGWTWDEFLDELVAFRLDSDNVAKGMLALQLVERLVPPADLASHREDVRRRVREAREASENAFAEIKASMDAAAAKLDAPKTIFDILFRRPAA